MRYKPGQIVFAEYGGFDNEIRKGLFLVLYSETDDTTTENQKNYIVVKVTSQLVDTTYVVKLSTKYNEFLQKDCYVACSKVHTFNYTQITGLLGEIDNNSLKKVFKCWCKFNYELERQCLERI